MVYNYSNMDDDGILMQTVDDFKLKVLVLSLKN